MDYPEYKASAPLAGSGQFASNNSDIEFAGLIIQDGGAGTLKVRVFEGTANTDPPLLELLATSASQIVDRILPVPIRTKQVYVEFTAGAGKARVVYA